MGSAICICPKCGSGLPLTVHLMCPPYPLFHPGPPPLQLNLQPRMSVLSGSSPACMHLQQQFSGEGEAKQDMMRLSPYDLPYILSHHPHNAPQGRAMSSEIHFLGHTLWKESHVAGGSNVL